MKKTLVIILSTLMLTACGDECSSYSDFSCTEIQNAEYNVHLTWPSGKSESLGHAKGLEQCGTIAWSFAKRNNFSRERNWGYVCCMIAKGSSCYEKHR